MKSGFFVLGLVAVAFASVLATLGIFALTGQAVSAGDIPSYTADPWCQGADANKDYFVDGADVGIVASYQDSACYGATENGSLFFNMNCAMADTNGDLFVDGADVGTVVSFMDYGCSGSELTESCMGSDVNQDGYVNNLDAINVVEGENWQSLDKPNRVQNCDLGNYYCRGKDVNKDGYVDEYDVLQLASYSGVEGCESYIACYDSDGGFNEYITGWASDEAGTTYDVCVTMSGISYVNEAYCYFDWFRNNWIRRSTYIPCGFGCSAGKCLTGSVPPVGNESPTNSTGNLTG